MPHPRLCHLTLVKTCFVLTSLLVLGCSSKTKTPPTSTKTPALNSNKAVAAPWTHKGAKAPYSIKGPALWEKLKPSTLNAEADLILVHRKTGQTVMMLAAPTRYGASSEDALRLFRRDGLATLRRNSKNYQLKKQGKATLGKINALSSVVQMSREGKSYEYDITYAIHSGWQFQWIHFGPTATIEPLQAEVKALKDAITWTTP